MNRTTVLQNSFIDLAAILFVVGGVASLVMSLLTIPLVSAGLTVAFSTVFLIVLGISLICSLGAIHCYTLATKRLLSDAGVRGIIFGSLLMLFSIGFIGNYSAPTNTFVMEFSSVLVLLGGLMCFVLRHVVLTSSPLLRHQQPIPQSA
ncbi:MAG: hypothetical protein ACLPY5_02415 [Candidatus Bathyarchaeia archaeon]